MYQKLKSLLDSDQIFTLILLVLVALGAFLLGRHSVADVAGQTATVPDVVPIRLIASPSPPSAPVSTGETEVVTEGSLDTSGEYVASKSGTKYHHKSCPGAKQIKFENQIWFQTVAEATAAGYTKAANCDQ